MKSKDYAGTDPRILRKIVEIDEELCDGCGRCIPNCAEGAIQIVDGKAKLVNEAHCDGLGACLGHCLSGAITIVEREAATFDKETVKANLEETQLECGCPSTAIQIGLNAAPEVHFFHVTALRHWPVQLRLVPVKAPFLNGVELLVMADCVPVAYTDLHRDLIRGRSVVIGCPKFDDAGSYAAKLGEILKQNDVRGVTVAIMEVPCCAGLRWVVDRAVEASGKRIPIRQLVVSVKGELREAER